MDSRPSLSRGLALRGNDGGTRRCPSVMEFAKYHEQTQHLIENNQS
jgi:hypothetical protein